MTDEEMPPEIDFRNGVRGLHQIPPGAKVILPPSAEKNSIEPPMNTDERR
jgi:hypothetical protein